MQANNVQLKIGELYFYKCNFRLQTVKALNLFCVKLLGGGGGGNSLIKMTWVLVGDFTTLKGTRISISGRGPN